MVRRPFMVITTYMVKIDVEGMKQREFRESAFVFDTCKTVLVPEATSKKIGEGNINCGRRTCYARTKPTCANSSRLCISEGIKTRTTAAMKLLCINTYPMKGYRPRWRA